MKSGRSEFLYLLVQELDRTGISWCCLRNHLEFFENSRSDVDLMILPEDQDLFERTLEEVGRQTSAKLLQKASYLNQSRTYLTPAGEWVRIDYETEVRWGIFPVLTARGFCIAVFARVIFGWPARRTNRWFCGLPACFAAN